MLKTERFEDFLTLWCDRQYCESLHNTGPEVDGATDHPVRDFTSSLLWAGLTEIVIVQNVINVVCKAMFLPECCCLEVR